MKTDFDYVVVGSGFGGSVSALRLAEKGYKVLVLEKGKRWTETTYPTSNWQLRKAFWMPSLGFYGTWSLKLLKEVLVLHGVGVGGGSLVYACTLFEPPDEVWDDPIWRDLEEWRHVMPQHYKTALRMLGGAKVPRVWDPDEALRKSAERRGKGDSFVPTTLSIFFGDPQKEVPDPYFGGEGPPRKGCTFCGACMVGCREGAKNTLDKNYLYLAEKRGAKVEPGKEVILLEDKNDHILVHWQVPWKHSEKGTVSAKGVVLSAGVLGTVPLLFRSRRLGGLPNISEKLGYWVRTNSEALLGVTSKSRKDLWKGVAIAAKVQVDPITHMEIVRFPKGSDVMLLLGTVLADGGGKVPRQLKWLWNLVRHPITALKVTVPCGKAEKSVVLLVMQTANNYTRLVEKRRLYPPFGWKVTTEPQPGSRIPSYIPVANEVAREIAEELDAIPQSSLNEVLLDRSTTAHILGGCAMAEAPDKGVVDREGRLFGHPRIRVVDGSIIGANLGVNPSLTITALAELLMSRIPDKATAHDG